MAGNGAARQPRRFRWVKTLVVLLAAWVAGVLFVRSARSVRAEPFEIPRDRLTGWTLAIEPASEGSAVLLSLRPQREMAAALFNQVFARTGESLSGPVPAAMPLVLQSELDAAGPITPEALLVVARAAGLESALPAPRCMAHRRVSAPRMVRQVYFLRFALPAFDELRRQVARRLRDAGVSSAFDPEALSPVLIVAASDAAFSRWLPLAPGAEDDCFAPIAVR